MTSTVAFSTAWRRFRACEGKEFKTKRGRSFRYQFKSRETLRPVVDGTEVERNLTMANFEKAFEQMESEPMSGRGSLDGIQGQSYVWAMLNDERVHREHR